MFYQRQSALGHCHDRAVTSQLTCLSNAAGTVPFSLYLIIPSVQTGKDQNKDVKHVQLCQITNKLTSFFPLSHLLTNRNKDTGITGKVS